MQTEKQKKTQAPPKEKAKANGHSQSNVKTVTMAELGPTLPIGTADTGTGGLVKEMVHRTWNLKREKELGKYRGKHKSLSVARFASMVVSTLYTKLGSLALGDDEAKVAQTLMRVGQMFMGDVMYAYVFLRYQVLGADLDLELTCPRCTSAQPMRADLGTVEVRTVDKLEDGYWTYTLRDPIDVRGQKVEGFVMGPPRWSAMEAATVSGGADTGEAKAALIHGSIDRIVGQEQIVLAPHELDELSKYDVEALAKAIDDNHLGPNMAVESTCQSCGHEMKLPIDWTYDSFFGVSGQSDQSKS